ncbi:hypothetical protein LOAG_08000 [Loa loa]|uniref:Uncharacterized protein n=1 Tax=Loa loa TaxID=7209 RepID=A0A1S0TUH1_LOALO|nr:hypothetical protein LOAG_08000 [Loa loa]EFO20492.1 hypothetical protein LOAG_08000 [Loa loa]
MRKQKNRKQGGISSMSQNDHKIQSAKFETNQKNLPSSDICKLDSPILYPNQASILTSQGTSPLFLEAIRNNYVLEPDGSQFAIFDHRPKIASDNASPRVDFRPFFDSRISRPTDI